VLGVQFETQDVRLAFWQRLLREEPVSVEEVDCELKALVRDSAMTDRMAYVLLRACVKAVEAMTPAMKRNLRAALIHWFSLVGSPCDPERHESMDPRRIRSVVGQRLTWADCAKLVGGNPEDYTAHRRLVDRLQEAVRAEWDEAFGPSCPFPGGE